jgi:hypothetical protein
MFGTQHSLQRRIERLVGHAQQAVDDIAANRNQLAHGVSVGLSLSRLAAYTERVREAMRKLDRQFA